MTIGKVVDASAVAAILFNEPEGDQVARELEGHALVAPTLLDYELANICWKKCRRDPTRQDTYLTACGLRGDLAIETAPVDQAAVLALALETGLTVYDASYVWLSRALSADLITLDASIRRVLAAT